MIYRKYFPHRISWREHESKGRRYYSNLATNETVRRLPEISPTVLERTKGPTPAKNSKAEKSSEIQTHDQAETPGNLSAVTQPSDLADTTSGSLVNLERKSTAEPRKINSSDAGETRSKTFQPERTINTPRSGIQEEKDSPLSQIVEETISGVSSTTGNNSSTPRINKNNSIEQIVNSPRVTFSRSTSSDQMQPQPLQKSEKNNSNTSDIVRTEEAVDTKNMQIPAYRTRRSSMLNIRKRTDQIENTENRSRTTLERKPSKSSFLSATSGTSITDDEVFSGFECIANQHAPPPQLGRKLKLVKQDLNSGGGIGSSGRDSFSSVSGNRGRDSFSSVTGGRGRDSFSSEYSTIMTEHLVRGGEEISLEEEIFTQMGMGEVHVLFASRGQHYPELRSKRKDERILCIARDFCGGFAIFLVSVIRSRGKYGGIHAGHPLNETFEVKIHEKNRENEKLIITVDGNEIIFVTTASNREKLESCARFALMSYQAFTWEQRFLLRLATVDFVKVFGKGLASSSFISAAAARATLGTAVTIPSVPYVNTGSSSPAVDGPAIVDKIITWRDSRPEVPMHELVSAIQDPLTWDKSLERLLDIVGSNEFDPRKYDTYIALLQRFLRCPSPAASEEAAFKRRIFRTKMDNFFQNIFKEEDRDNLQELHIQCDAMLFALDNYVSRSELPDIPFSNEFFSEMSRSQKEKRRQQMRESFMAQDLPVGIYFGVLLFTREGEIIGDMKDNIPTSSLRNIHFSEWADALTSYNDDFQWLLSLGWNLTESIRDLERTHETQLDWSPFRRAFVSAASHLQSQLNHELGVLYDKPIRLKTSKSMILLSVCQVADKRRVNLRDGQYKWNNQFQFEHRMYQRYEMIELFTRLETMDSSFDGPRWIEAAIKYHQSLRTPLAPGLYLGYLKVTISQDDTYIMVSNKDRQIPTEFVSNRVNNDNWRWVQNLRLRDMKGEPMIDESIMVDSDTPDSLCGTFEHRFIRAMLRMEERIPSGTLGALYDLERIHLDLQGKIQMCLFVDIIGGVDDVLIDQDEHILDDESGMTLARRGDLALPLEYRNKFLWKRKACFETLNLMTYMPTVHNMIVSSWMREVHRSKNTVNSTEIATDECLRRRCTISMENLPFVVLEKSVSSIGWINQIIPWILEGSPSVCDVQKETGARRTSTDLLSVVKFHEQRRQDIIQAINTDNIRQWQSIVKQWMLQDQTDVIEEDAKNPPWTKGESTESTEGIDWDAIQVNEYSMEITIDDIRDIDTLLLQPTTNEVCENLVREFIDRAMLTNLDNMEQLEIEQVVDEMIGTLEAQEERDEQTIVKDFTREMQKSIYAERRRIKIQMSRLGSEALKFESPISPTSPEKDTETKANSKNQELKDIFSRRDTYDPIVARMAQEFEGLVSTATNMFESITGIQESIELAELVYAMDSTQLKRKMLMNEVRGIENDENEFSTGTEQENDPAMTLPLQTSRSTVRKFVSQEGERIRRDTERIDKDLRSIMKRTPIGLQGFSLPVHLSARISLQKQTRLITKKHTSPTIQNRSKRADRTQTSLTLPEMRTLFLDHYDGTTSEKSPSGLRQGSLSQGRHRRSEQLSPPAVQMYRRHSDILLRKYATIKEQTSSLIGLNV